jgi:hypothetical protein
MIKEYGTVVITADQVLVTGFAFEGVANMGDAAREAVEWAKARLNEEETTGDSNE